MPWLAGLACKMLFPDDLLSLAHEVIGICQKQNLRLAAAESCTGGLVMACLTAIPGASDVVERGFVAYVNQAKIEMLGVSAELLAAHGAVSEEVAIAMAKGALSHSTANISVAVTGVAGPGGGSPNKPVGLVFLAAARQGGIAICQRHDFKGDRHQIRRQTVQAALEMLKDISSGQPDQP